MQLSNGLTDELDRALASELRGGEEVWWVGMPDSKRAGRRRLGLALFGVLFGGFALMWIVMAAAIVWMGVNESEPGAKPMPVVLATLFPLFGLPFLAIGVGMASAPWWARRAARRTACAVTNQRALRIACGSSVRVHSWSPRDIGEITKELHSDGRGTLLFARSSLHGRGRRKDAPDEGFDGVPDPNACERALIDLKVQSAQSTAPAGW
jgi:hypothetical protein